VILLLFTGASVAPPPVTDTRGYIAMTDAATYGLVTTVAAVYLITPTDATTYGLVVSDALSP
jgi:hypothetical protein